MLKSGFSSQSGGRSLGRFEDFGDGLGEGPGVSGEKDKSLEDEDADAEGFICEELPVLVEAKRRQGVVVDVGIRYCHPTLTSRRLGLNCRYEPWRTYEMILLANE